MPEQPKTYELVKADVFLPIFYPIECEAIEFVKVNCIFKVNLILICYENFIKTSF